MVRENIVNCKRGWIRLVEVFVAIVLLTGVLLIISNRNSSYQTDLQTEISKKQTAILRDIELNETLRTAILSVPTGNLPVEWEDFETSGLSEVGNRITSLSTKDLQCTASICLATELCTIEDSSGGEIYAKSVFISANLTVYSPRQLKLFCTRG